MVRDGYYYGLACLAVALLLGWLTFRPWSVIPFLLGAFFLWFFRDPNGRSPRGGIDCVARRRQGDRRLGYVPKRRALHPHQYFSERV